MTWEHFARYNYFMDFLQMFPHISFSDYSVVYPLIGNRSGNLMEFDMLHYSPS
jgi:hypothetical protein